MNTTDRAEILDRLAAGQINAAEAMKLLDQQPAAELPKPVDALKAEAASEWEEMPAEALKQSIKVDVPEEPAVLKTAEGYPETTVISGNGGKPRWLKIRVRDRETGRNKVTVTLPVGLVSFGLGMARRFGADMGDVDPDEMMTMLKSGERGMLVEVDDEEDNEHVQIYLD